MYMRSEQIPILGYSFSVRHRHVVYRFRERTRYRGSIFWRLFVNERPGILNEFGQLLGRIRGGTYRGTVLGSYQCIRQQR